MTKYRKILLFIMTGIIILGIDSVNAKTLKFDDNIMCDNGNYFNIEGTVDPVDFYTRNKVQKTGFGLYLEGAHTYSNGSSNFTYSRKNAETKCYYVIEGNQDNYEWYYYSCNQKYANDQITIDNQGTKSEQILDKNTGKITIKLTVTGELAKQFDRVAVETKYSGSVGTITKDATNKKITISGISPAQGAAETMYVMMYLTNPNSGDFYKNAINAVENCSVNGKLLVNYVKVFINTTSFFDINVGSDFINSAECQAVRSFENATEDFKRGYVPECYNENLVVSYNEYVNMGKTIRSKLGTLNTMFGPLDNKDLIDTKDLKCTDSNLGIKTVNVDNKVVAGQDMGTGKAFERKRTYESCGTYWCGACYEEYYVEADDPQLVFAGEGVKYDNRVEVRRYCEITKIKEAQKPQPCQETCTPGLCAAHGFWGNTGGPTSDFDSCVKKCDGGEYTQECINTCYDKEYNGNDNSVFSKLNAFRNKITLNTPTKINEGTTYMDPNSEVAQYVSSTDNGTTMAIFTDYSDGDHSVTIGHSSYVMTVETTNARITGIDVTAINPLTNEVIYLPNQTMDFRNNPGKIITFTNVATGEVNTVYEDARCFNHEHFGCQITCTVGPAGCSWNPEAEYQAQLNASKSEYQNLYSLFTDRERLSPINKYTMTIEDTETGKKYEVSGDSTHKLTGVTLDINRDDNLTSIYTGPSVGVKIGSEGDSITVPLQFSSKVIYNIKLPQQYTVKGEPNRIIVKGTDGYYEKVESSKGYTFKKVNIDSENKLAGGKNVYYTSLNSKDTNKLTICEKITDHSVTNPSTTDSTKLITNISKNYELKSQLPNNATRAQLLTYWQDAARITYLTDYSINAYVAYINKDNLIVKTLREEKDNIDVSFEIGTLGSTPFTKSGYKCYYGVYNMLKNTEKDECDGNPGLRYYYHEINPEKVFDQREPRWNWTGTITSNKVTGAAANISGYIVDPERLIAAIEAKGNTIYTDEGIQNQEMDYEFTLTDKIIRDIRKYNSTKVKINNKTQRIPYTTFTLAVANNSRGDNFSEKIAEWLGGTVKDKEIAISACNNSLSGSCYNYGLGGK